MVKGNALLPLITTIGLLMLFVPLTINDATAYVSDERCIEEYNLPAGEECTKAQKCYIEFGRECATWELGETAFTSNPLGTMLLPFDHMFQGMSIVIFWSLLIGILWLRTENPQLVGIIGVVMVSAYSYAVDPSLQSPEFETARFVGTVLILVSVGISVYQLIATRIFAPPQ
ncbi:MAG: hypothetical protein CMB80_01425 [Flammeovirgaceae bacterium]|nr:hypothetical protein [Flammeovirgaceae bacterium]